MSQADLMAYTIAEIARIRPASKGKLEPGFVYSWGRNRFAGGIRHVLNAGDVAKLSAGLGADHGRILFAGGHVREGKRGMEAAAETGERAEARLLRATA